MTSRKASARSKTRPAMTCPTTGKAGFTTKSGAKANARTFHNGTHPYHCPHCSYWHLGYFDTTTTRQQMRERAWEWRKSDA